MKLIFYVVVIGIILMKAQCNGNIIRNKRQSTYDYDENESGIVFPDSEEETGDRFWINRPYKRPNQVQYQYRPQRPQTQYQYQQFLAPQPNRPQYQQFQQQQPQQNRPQYQYQQFQPTNNYFQTTSQPPPPATTLTPELRDCNIKCSESVTHEFNPVCGTNNQTYNNRGFLECARRCGVQTQFLRDGRCRPRLRPVS